MGSSASDKNMQQYVAIKKGGPFQLVNGNYPTPGPNEICIRNRAVALNPLDWKNLHYGQMVNSWPEVFGIDTAGVVEVVGDKVTTFKAGDAVMSSAGLGGRRGAFQDITTVPAHFACRKPSSWSFAQACSAPICYLAAAAAITKGLSTPLPYLKPLEPLQEDPMAASATGSEYQQHLRKKSLGGTQHLESLVPLPPPLNCILVVGGSSGVGASAIQLLRLALPDATILSTNSVAQNRRLVALGATACIDRTLPDAELVSAIKAASPRGAGVDAILDAVAAAADNASLFDVLARDGARLYTNVFTGREVDAPDGVKSVSVFAHMMLALEGMGAMGKLVDLVDEGKYKLPLEVEVVGRGLDDIGAGLETLKGGVSGVKLVVAL